MAVTMNARWDDSGTVIPGGDAEYVVAEQPIAEYDNWFNYNIVADIQAVIDDVINKFNANTILKADSDNTPAALVVAEQTIVGRKTGNSIAALIDSEVLAIIGVEAGADVTDSTNVNAAGAVMENDFDATTFLYATSDNTPEPKTPAEVRSILNIMTDVVNDTSPQLGGTLDTNSKQVRLSKGSDVASAGALSLGTDGNYFDITGTNTITSIGTLGIGTVVILQFDSALTITHDEDDLYLPTASDIVTMPNDVATFIERDTGKWLCTSYVVAGLPMYDFTTFTETDPNAHITVTTARNISVDDLLQNEEAWVVLDLGSLCVSGDFIMDYDIIAYAPITSTGVGGLGLSTSVNDINTANSIFACFNDSGDHMQIVMDGGFGTPTALALTLGNKYYIRLKRVGSTVTMEVHNDTERTETSLLESETETDSTAYRYLYGVNTYNDGTNQGVKLDIYNLRLWYA